MGWAKSTARADLEGIALLLENVGTHGFILLLIIRTTLTPLNLDGTAAVRRTVSFLSQ